MGYIKKITDFIIYDIWRKTGEGLGKWKRLGYLALRSVVLTVRGFFDDDINTRANALTCSMLFALVPILALVLAISKGFGFESIIEDKLNESFLGSMGLVPTIMGFVERYLETAQGGAFLGIGLLILLWSVYSFFQNIESSFNTIWQVKRSRSYIRQFTTYIAILLIIPILIVVSSGLSIFLNSTFADMQFFATMAPIKEFFIRLTPFLLCWSIFTWMYWMIPNTKVGLWAALIPGVLIGTFFQLLQMLSVYLMVFLSRTSIVYGAFAAIPLLLTWSQFSCLFMLSGAELSFAIQNNEDFDYEHDLKHISRRYKDYVTLFLTYVIVKRFTAAEPPQTAHEMATEHRLPTRLVNQLLGRLVETGIVRESYVEGNEEKTYMPALDPQMITIGKVISQIEQQGNEQFLLNPTEERERFWKRYLKLKETGADLNKVLISEMI